MSNTAHTPAGVAPAGVPAPAAPRMRVLRRIDNALARTTEVAVVALVVAEVVLLGSSTVARYVFDAPLIWSDELATILFLWLAMLGAVVALRRGEHMRLTAFVARPAGGTRAWAAMRSAPASRLRSCSVLVMPAYGHFDDMRIGLSPVMEIQRRLPDRRHRGRRRADADHCLGSC